MNVIGNNKDQTSYSFNSFLSSISNSRVLSADFEFNGSCSRPTVLYLTYTYIITSMKLVQVFFAVSPLVPHALIPHKDIYRASVPFRSVIYFFTNVVTIRF